MYFLKVIEIRRLLDYNRSSKSPNIFLDQSCNLFLFSSRFFCSWWNWKLIKTNYMIGQKYDWSFWCLYFPFITNFRKWCSIMIWILDDLKKKKYLLLVILFRWFLGLDVIRLHCEYFHHAEKIHLLRNEQCHQLHPVLLWPFC